MNEVHWTNWRKRKTTLRSLPWAWKRKVHIVILSRSRWHWLRYIAHILYYKCNHIIIVADWAECLMPFLTSKQLHLSSENNQKGKPSPTICWRSPSWLQVTTYIVVFACYIVLPLPNFNFHISFNLHVLNFECSNWYQFEAY